MKNSFFVQVWKFKIIDEKRIFKRWSIRQPLVYLRSRKMCIPHSLFNQFYWEKYFWSAFDYAQKLSWFWSNDLINFHFKNELKYFWFDIDLTKKWLDVNGSILKWFWKVIWGWSSVFFFKKIDFNFKKIKVWFLFYLFVN